MSEKPGRYQTSMGAMVGAMLVLVVGVLAFVLLRDANRQSAETQPEPVEWEAAVAYAQDQGLSPVHPSDLPDGWTVTSAQPVNTADPVWGMGMLTDTGAFVGIWQEDESPIVLLEEKVDEDADEGQRVTIEGDLGGEWSTYTDDGGDLALVLERDQDVVMVYGSAPSDVLREVAASLTEAPLSGSAAG